MATLLADSGSNSFDVGGAPCALQCKPKKCRQECKRSCPVNSMGKMCITVEATSKVAWSELLQLSCCQQVSRLQRSAPPRTMQSQRSCASDAASA